MQKILIFVAVGLAIAGVVWYSFLRDKQPAPLLQTTDLTTASAVDGDLVATLLQLRAVSLSGTIFTDPAFMSLKDNGKEIIPEPVGRQNPFAPLNAAAAVSAKPVPVITPAKPTAPRPPAPAPQE